MAGVSNSSYRILAKEFGAGMLFAEMVSDKGLLYDNEKTKSLLYMTDEEKPLVQQIFGSDEETMVAAAKYVDKYSNADYIDINMGCPVPKVALRAQAGASLLKDPDKIYKIVKAVKNSVEKPISVKIRSGWDFDSINAVEVAKKIEEAGASFITIHARTRSQMYSGKADLDIIKQIKENVNIPVVGNGDIIDGPSAKRMLDYTKCDYIMVGRAALGNPFIFREINAYLEDGTILEKPTSEEIKTVMLRHLDLLIKQKGEHIALLEMRSHGTWYLKGLPNASQTRKRLSQVTSKDEFITIIHEFFVKK